MSKWTRFQIGFDLHGDQQDAKAVNTFFEFADYWKPKIRIAGGDIFDFRPLRKGASDDERRESLREDFNAGKQWFEKFRPTHFLRGNHDERIYELAENGSGIAADYAQEGVGRIKALVDSCKTKMLPYHKRNGLLQLGNLKVLHGFYCGVYAARQHALTYGACLFGHIHAIDEHAIPGLDRRVARACGALCKLDLDYNSRQPNTLRQAHGFPYGLLNEKTGNYFVYQAESIDGKWMLPSEFSEF